MAKKNKTQLAPRVVKRAISLVRKDIADWNNARRAALSPTNPKQYRLQDLYVDIFNDALLSSQVNNRVERTLAAPYELVAADGTVDDQITAQLRAVPFMLDLMQAILHSEYYGYSLVEISTDGAQPSLTVLPRQNVDIVNGEFLADVNDAHGVPYRQLAEYGRFILEFNSETLGLFNKCVPHVLFKKFAQSCWSELCEIYGIPPRYLKTNTQDPAMLDRAQHMLADMGAAAAFVIDTTEEFQFAQGVTTNGDVYANLVRQCNNEISMLVSGAIIGQDTENGNYSKEQASIAILDRLVDSDRRTVEMYLNTEVIPALVGIGLLPAAAASLTFRFSAVEDDEQTWQRVRELLPYKDIDNKWLTEKFGIPVEDKSYGDSGLSAHVERILTSGDPDFFA